MSQSQPLKKILFVHSSDEMYGADRILLQMVTRLGDLGFEPIVVIPTDVPYQKSLSSLLQAQGIQTLFFKTAVLRRMYFNPIGLLMYLWRFVATLFFLIRLIRKEGIEIVHSNTLSILPGAFAARFTGRPHVWHVHEIIVKPRRLHQLTSYLALRFSDQVVAVSQPTRDHLVSGTSLDPSHVQVINNGIELDRFEGVGLDGIAIRNSWDVKVGERLIGMVGRVSRWKGQDHFLRACKLVADQRDGVRFALVGDPPHGQEELVENLKSQIVRDKLEKHCILTGFRKDIPAILNAFDIFVLPSTLPDPFPTTVLEAMAASRPVVANRHGGSIEMVEDGVTGFLVSPNDPQAMAERLIELIDMTPPERKQIGSSGRARLETYFSIDSFMSKWVSIYEGVIKR